MLLLKIKPGLNLLKIQKIIKKKNKKNSKR